jgi:hypothetical protein
MALQDLTPQLRTRLSRMERLVGLFVSLATLLLLTGFVYYAYHTAQRKGWTVMKVPYYTMIGSATGLKVGDPVKCMGFEVGQITKFEPMPPDSYYNVFVAFTIKDPFFGYVWTDSEVRVGSADFLGNRYLEVSKGGTSTKTNVHATYRFNKGDLEMWVDYDPDDKTNSNCFASVKILRSKTKDFKGTWLVGYEPPPLADQLSRVIGIVESNLPNVFALTNQIATVMTNAAQTLTNLNVTVAGAHPILSNITQITGHLRNPEGSLGQWLIPTNLTLPLQTTLGSAHDTLVTADTNLTLLAGNLNKTLENIAGITSNLNSQVQANSLILSDISSLIVNADDFVQGLKRNWLLKGAFGPGTNPPPPSLVQPTVGGRR